MNKFTHLGEFLGMIFDEQDTLQKAKEVVTGILKARSPRLSDISREMHGNEAANGIGA